MSLPIRTCTALMLAAAVPDAVHASNIWADVYLGDRWHGVVSTDPISDATVFSVYVATARVNDTTLGPDLARVGLTCRAGKARLVFEWSFKAAGAANLTVEYRFEGRPGRSVKARYVNRTLEEATAVADIRQFLADAGESQSLIVRVNSDMYGISTATFRTKAGADMAARFAAACPVVSPR
jgi:hypothetical protein